MKPSSLTVAQLRDELKARGLDTTGLKAVLVERLEAALADGGGGAPAAAPAAAPPPAAAPAPAPVAAAPAPAAAPPAAAPAAPAPAAAAAPAPVSAAPAETGGAGAAADDEAAKRAARAARFGIPEKPAAPPPAAGCVRKGRRVGGWGRREALFFIACFRILRKRSRRPLPLSLALETPRPIQPTHSPSTPLPPTHTKHTHSPGAKATPAAPAPAAAAAPALPTLTPEERRAEFEKRKARAIRFGLPIPIDPFEEAERAAARAARFQGGTGAGPAT
jgi:hypothetical protein